MAIRPSPGGDPSEAKKKGKGAWEKALTAIGDNRQRADENIKIASLFTSVEDAGKCPVRRALKPIRKGAKGITARAIGYGDNRRENDAYYTPLEAITALLNVEKFEGLTWEPAEGDGRILRALQRIGCEVIGSDIKTGTDFRRTYKEVDNIVTNPPWKIKTAFIRHAKECSRRKVAMSLPLSALAGVARRPLHQDAEFPLRTVYVFVRRLDFGGPGDGPDEGVPSKRRSSTIIPGWFVWERGDQGQADCGVARLVKSYRSGL